MTEETGGTEEPGTSDADRVDADGDGAVLSALLSSVLLQVIRGELGDEGVDRLVSQAGVACTPEQLQDAGGWVRYQDAIALLEAAGALTGDPHIGRRVGAATVSLTAGDSPTGAALRSLGSPEAVYLKQQGARFGTVSEQHVIEAVPGRVVQESWARPGLTRHRLLCDWTAGLLSQTTVLFGMPPAQVVEPCCQSRGDERCRFEITWEPQHSPEERIAALEAQLEAMGKRLESMYATARDLIATDDVELALARITDRAATAVRAPKHLLAVRFGANERPHVHHRGFASQQEADAEGERLLSEDCCEPADARLVADVQSGSRHYGRLMAAWPSGGVLDAERNLLEVYARYAASVLDTATALDEARRRQEQAHGLLRLSQAVARASSRDEVAQRLTENVPLVLDCDRVAVYLWDEHERALLWRAATGMNGSVDELTRGLRIRATDTPLVDRMVSDLSPEPLFLGPDADDDFVRGVLRQTGTLALVVVPIVSHGHFYGIVNLGVVERPERLEKTPSLLYYLAGLVAQAATALDNARLIETMAYQARHDSLTGLVGHRGFQEELERGAADDSGTPFTLAMVDIDNFKAINDQHGHPVGDEALCQVAEALRRSVRERDTVFRVGGEEFAILLPGLNARDALPVAERVREAVGQIPFVKPMTVSIGLVSWPDHAADRRSLLERADAALYEAKLTGKDRVSLSATGAAASAE